MNFSYYYVNFSSVMIASYFYSPLLSTYIPVKMSFCKLVRIRNYKAQLMQYNLFFESFVSLQVLRNGLITYLKRLTLIRDVLAAIGAQI